MILKISEYRSKVNNAMCGFKVCGKKIKTAGQFIDYFIHNLLDYSVLNNDSKNFKKNPECFEIREALTTVIQMVEDKTFMKRI